MGCECERAASEQVACSAEDPIIKEGEDGDHFYMVDSGKFEASPDPHRRFVRRFTGDEVEMRRS